MARHRSNKGRRAQRRHKAVVAQQAATRSALRVPAEVLVWSARNPEAMRPKTSFAPLKPPPGVVPADATGLAMDSASVVDITQWASEGVGYGVANSAGFMGYPYLAELSQLPEYRRISETLANEMTRTWITIRASGDEDKTDRIAEIEAEMRRLNLQDVIREAVEIDGLFGRSHLYIDTGATEDRDELRTDLGNGHNAISKGKVAKGSLRAVRCVEPVWCYPSSYNSNDPLVGDWYNPSTWFVQGKEVHVSRLLRIVGREVPDLLKPAYSFGGLPMSQIAKPYIDNWIRTRQSVSDLLHSFSVSGVKIDLINALETEKNGQGLFDRVALFTNLRDNRGTMVLDKEEEFFNVSTPLGSLDKLQAQSQEHMSAVSGIPIVKLLGIQPAGLNASSEGELECFYTWVNSLQEKMLRAPIHTILGFIQLSLFGEVDPEITFAFEALDGLDDMDAASIRKIEAETGAVLIGAGVLSPEDERRRIASDSDTAYAALDVDSVPQKPTTPLDRAQIVATVTAAASQAYESGLVERPQALRELMDGAAPYGGWGSLTEEDIAEAEAEPPPAPETELEPSQEHVPSV